MSNLYFTIFLLTSVLTWMMDSPIRKQAEYVEKWIAGAVLIMGIGFTFLKKFNIHVVMPPEFFTQWIAPWVHHFIGLR